MAIHGHSLVCVHREREGRRGNGGKERERERKREKPLKRTLILFYQGLTLMSSLNFIYILTFNIATVGVRTSTYEV